MKLIILVFVSVLVSLSFCAEDDDAMFVSKNYPNLKIGVVDGKGWLTKRNPAYQHFKVVQGLCGKAGTISFKSVASPGKYLRHQGFRIKLHSWKNTALYKKDACFYPRYNKYFRGYTAYQSVNYPGRYIRHRGFKLYIDRIQRSNLYKNDVSWQTTAPQVQQVVPQFYDDAMFVSINYPDKKIGIKNGYQGWLTDENVAYQHYKVVQGLCGKGGTISFESVSSPGKFLRHQNFEIKLHDRDNSDLYKDDACFYPRYNKYFNGYTAYESVNYPSYFIRHRGFRLYIDAIEFNDLYKKDVSWKTTIPQVQHVYTYSNALFVSINYPNKTIGVKNGNEGWLTADNPALQHFRVVEGLSGVAGTISFQSVAFPTMFLRHQNFEIFLHDRDSSDLYRKDASFFPRYNKYFTGYTAYESVNYPNRYIRHRGFRLYLDPVDNSDLYRKDVSWKTTLPQQQHVSTYGDVIFQSKNYPSKNLGIVSGDKGYLTSDNPKLQHFRIVQGICGVAGTVSFESVASPGKFLRHQNYEIYLHSSQNTALYKNDACFFPRNNKYFTGYTAYESVNYPYLFIRHKGFRLYIDSYDGSELFRNDASWKTTFPQSQYVSLYKNVMFVSINYPAKKIGVERNGVRGLLTDDNISYQNYNLVQGLCGVTGTVSFESVASPGSFLRHQGYEIKLHSRENTALYKNDACFYPRYNKYFTGYTAYQSVNYPKRFIRHRGFKLYIDTVENTDLYRKDVSWKTTRPNTQYMSTYEDATFVSYDWPTHKIGIQHGNEGYLTNNNVAYQHYKIVQGLCSIAGTISFESVANPGEFLRHRGFRIYLDPRDSSDLYRSDACFFPRNNKYFTGYTAYESVNYPNQFIRHANFILHINNDDGSDLFKKGASWKTTIPQVQYATTYSDAVFVSINYPTKNIGIMNNNRGMLTSDNPPLQHFKVVQGLCGVAGTISFESVVRPGNFLRHQNFKIYLHNRENSDLYRSDACFFPRYNKFFEGYTAYESVNYPNRFIRHRGFELYLDSVENRDLYRRDVSWKTEEIVKTTCQATQTQQVVKPIKIQLR